MDSEIKTRWVSALRSGNYHQGANYLRTKGAEKDNFCCLGVLCELAVAEGVISPPTLDPHGEYYYGVHSSYLPDEVIKWSGLNSRNGSLDYSVDRPYDTVADMNDSEIPFAEIADVIEVEF